MGTTSSDEASTRPESVASLSRPSFTDSICGYSELVNKGKSIYNEDHAAFEEKYLTTNGIVAYAIFDGHGGPGASHYSGQNFLNYLFQQCQERKITSQSSDREITQLLTRVFFEFDQILREKRHQLPYKCGGSTVILTFLLFPEIESKNQQTVRIFVANAGDCRALLLSDAKTTVFSLSPSVPSSSTSTSVKHAEDPSVSTDTGKVRISEVNHLLIYPLSRDHTPESDLGRLESVVSSNPTLHLGDHFRSTLDSSTENQSKSPIVIGSGKKARVLGIIGTTRGFGDFDLIAAVPGPKVHLKAYLTARPEIFQTTISINKTSFRPSYILMACDGVWDKTTNEEATRCILDSIKSESQPASGFGNMYSYAASQLVKLAEKSKSGDDITVLLVPIHELVKVNCKVEL